MGVELSVKTVKRALDELIAAGQVAFTGDKRWRRYRLAVPPANTGPIQRAATVGRGVSSGKCLIRR